MDGRPSPSSGSAVSADVITSADMMEPLLEACPAFRPTWVAFLEEWRSEPELPLYLAIADLARHLISALAVGDAETLTRVFAVVERWHVEGDQYVREVATVGLLEDLQNEGLHASTKPAELERFLLPVSLEFWRKVERFWQKGEIITED